ncbi:unnamed protein product [Pieris macdunnoughi]|uniref:Arginine kinase n=1 Tax=Pieris macdunnoughi TaxID=345717 RepID=A0A821TV83_9NEOP|nr:unnamed protein product [Pieris macdunnoughi]
MKSVKKLLSEKAEKKQGLYVHYSPPKALGAIPASDLRQWVRAGQEGKLERAVLNGQGRRLLSEAENLPLSRYLINLINKCETLHAAVETGSLLDLQELLESDYNRNKLSSCCDDAGVGLLHKAVYYNYTDIVEYLVKYYPHLVHQKDSEGRIALHYTAACRDEAQLSALLLGAGAARGARDAAGHTLAHYRTARTQLTLPVAVDMPTLPGMVIKRHNIRIWCHECDMGRLQRVIWEGQGSRLLSEVSSQPIVKKFLETVPYMMNTIKDIHNAVIQNDLENVIRLTSSPVPPQILSSKDPNNMTVFHKAAGLGHCGILNYIVERYPQGINEIDNEGRTPLHYAAIVKDDKHTFKTMIGFGADEGAVDNRNKTPAYYLNRPQEIDKRNLKVLPEAPRTPSSAYPASWDWKILDTDYTAELNKKPRRKNFKTSSENISSKNTLSESTENLNNMKNSSTHEMINSLPELNDKHETIEEEKINNITENIVLQENEQVSENVDHEACFVENQDYKENTSGDNKIEDTLKETSNGGSRPNSQNGLDRQNEHTNLEQPEEEENLENNIEQVNDLNTAITKSDPVFNSEVLNRESTPLPVLPASPIFKSTDNADTDDQINQEDNNEDESCTQLDIIENKNPENMPESTHSQEGNVEKHDDDHISKNDIEGNQPNDSFEDINVVQKEVEPDKLLNSNEATVNEIQNKMEYDHSDEEVTTVSDHEGNNGRNSQESLIEGIVSSEAEKDSQDASVIKGNSVHGDLLVIDNQIDPEVTELINTVNLEMLATLVLNGEGSRLIGRYSDNLELQAFLENVPSYMHKINKVHLAAKEGNIRELQAALDRRKFAIARDPISANGATPLHVATVFGKTNIIKYLGGRFPETLSAVDFEGRTALHYAAVLPDNGHYYNLLQQLGSNSKDLDDNGRSADDYYRNPSLLPFSQLLSDFGISDDEIKEMFSDQVPDDRVSSRRNLDMPEVLETLDRCYHLLTSAKSTRTPLSASSNKATPPLVLGRFLKKSIFESIKHRITKLDHDLFDVIWPAVKKIPETRNVIQTVEEDFPGGVTAPDYYVYDVFNEFLTPLIKDLHNINISYELPFHPPSDFIKNSSVLLTAACEPLVELNVDAHDEFVLSGNIECSRNVEGFELPLNIKIGKLESIERIITTILMNTEFSKVIEQLSSESDQKGGSYYTLNEVLEKPSEICALLAASGLLIALCEREEIDDFNRLHGKHWPYGRGVYLSDDKHVAVWINVHDHIRVVVSTPTDTPGEIGLAFSKLSYIMKYLHDKLDFVWHEKLGHLSSRPTFLGAGIRLSLIINFPGLSRDADNIKHLCAMRGLQYRETLSTGIARISNYQCLSVTETVCFNDFATATSNLLHLERDLSLQNSAQIATMLSINHASYGQLDIPIFQTEEGRYLAKSLGDPLIKGLTEVANVKPKDPIAFLATFLHNFPDHEKPQLGTQENTLITNEPPEYENQTAPDELKKPYSSIQSARNRPTGPIEVITVDPQLAASPDAPEVAPSSAERDEHGQSMLHFAAARTHTNNALFQLLQETDVSIGYRDELYRTARDISIQANVLENTGEIDRFVLHLAARGNTDKIMELLLQGYDHILDVVDEEGVPINEVISQRGDSEMSSLMASIPTFEESRERLHVAVRRGDLSEVREILSAEGGKTLARAQNSYGRTPLHVAVLAQNEEIVEYLAEIFPGLLKIGDNLERTPLHYAMGVEKMESLSRILTRAGAKRVLKDLKGRQPTYYYMNKSDILRLKEEEEMY